MPSSVIRHFSYDAKSRRLDILFVTGRRYAYQSVPPETAADFCAAFSKGQYFNARIRDAFPYTEYTEPLRPRRTVG